MVDSLLLTDVSPVREPAPETDSDDEIARIGENVDGITGDFTGKQFDKKRVACKVQEQYDEEHARIFYQHAMGGGGLDIHYGIFRSPTDGVYEASKATNRFLMQQLDWMNPLSKKNSIGEAPRSCCILDLGSGTGGLSHEMALEFDCKVVSFNLCAEQNDMNLQAARKMGLSPHRVEVIQGNFNQGLPADWTDRFTHIVSAEVFCHAGDKTFLLNELMRVLKPSGALVFTDIMGADGADEAALKDFTDRNATTAMARPSEYLDLLRQTGFENVSFWDGSCHLVHYFRAMLRVCLSERKAMIKKGVPSGYLDNWERSLTERCKIQTEKSVFAWGVMSARKTGEVVSKKHVVVIPRLEEMQKPHVIEAFEQRLGDMKGVADFMIAGRLSEVPLEFLAKAEILFTSWGHAPDALTDFEKSMPKLKWVHLLTAGMSPVVQRVLTDRTQNSSTFGEPHLVTTGKGSFSAAIAEYVLAAVMHFKKNVTQILSMQKKKMWKHPIENVQEIGNANLTIGLVGYGSIGKAVAKLFTAMGAIVWYTNTKKADTNSSGQTSAVSYTSKHDDFSQCHVENSLIPSNEPIHVERERLFREADVIVSSLPETPATKHMFDEAAFLSMKENSVFVNVGRGTVVDEDALVKHAAKFAGIILDVFQQEPLPVKSELWDLPNALLTPHCLVFSDRFSNNVLDCFQKLLGEFLNDMTDRDDSHFNEASFRIEKGY